MKIFFVLICCLASTSQAATLTTSSYEVTIDVGCPEGNVSCDQVRYTGVSRKSGKSIVLKGRTHHTLCADGVTPCRFLGYVFKSGKIRYFVSDDGELVVSQGEKVLVQESGTWRD